MAKTIKFKGGGILFADRVEYITPIHTPMSNNHRIFSNVPKQYQFTIKTTGDPEGYSVLFSDKALAIFIRADLVEFLQNSDDSGIFVIEGRKKNYE